MRLNPAAACHRRSLCEGLISTSTPIASIRLYLETLQAREVGEVQRHEFYKVMLADADRLQHTVEQVLKAGVAGQRPRLAHATPVNVAALAEECVQTARRRHHLDAGAVTLAKPDGDTPLFVSGDVDELRTAMSNLLDNAVKYSLQNVQVQVEVAASDSVMPGVVSLPHGYGHGLPGVRLRNAVGLPGASINDLTDPERVDVSGNAVLNGTPVTVSG